MSKLHSYELVQTIHVQGAQPMHTQVISAGPEHFEEINTQGSLVRKLLYVDGRAWINGSYSLWRTGKLSSAMAEGLANYWWQEDQRPSIAAIAEQAKANAPASAFASCRQPGTVVRAGVARIDGRRAVIVRDPGSTAGSSRGTLAVAASGQPYMLVADGTGGARLGGRGCARLSSHPKPTTIHTRYLDLNSVRPVNPPRKSTPFCVTAANCAAKHAAIR